LDKYLLICALTIATVGAVKDVRGQRIPNWLTYSGLLAALVVRAGLGGWTELKGGLAGMLFAGGIFFLLFFIGGMGGGDV
jgi:prepilin peptidase CpaA